MNKENNIKILTSILKGKNNITITRINQKQLINTIRRENLQTTKNRINKKKNKKI